MHCIEQLSSLLLLQWCVLHSEAKSPVAMAIALDKMATFRVEMFGFVSGMLAHSSPNSIGMFSTKPYNSH